MYDEGAQTTALESRALCLEVAEPCGLSRCNDSNPGEQRRTSEAALAGIVAARFETGAHPLELAGQVTQSEGGVQVIDCQRETIGCAEACCHQREHFHSDRKVLAGDLLKATQNAWGAATLKVGSTLDVLPGITGPNQLAYRVPFPELSQEPR